MDQYLDQYAKTQTINGQQTRFFSGKVAVNKEMKEGPSPSQQQLLFSPP
jgi:hypothetical protein